MRQSKTLRIKKILWAQGILGLEGKASYNDVNKAFRRLAIRYHPDKCDAKRQEVCERKMKELNSAYEILLDYCGNYQIPIFPESLQQDIVDPMERFHDDWMWGKK